MDETHATSRTEGGRRFGYSGKTDGHETLHAFVFDVTTAVRFN